MSDNTEPTTSEAFTTDTTGEGGSVDDEQYELLGSGGVARIRRVTPQESAEYDIGKNDWIVKFPMPGQKQHVQLEKTFYDTLFTDPHLKAIREYFPEAYPHPDNPDQILVEYLSKERGWLDFKPYEMTLEEIALVSYKFTEIVEEMIKHGIYNPDAKPSSFKYYLYEDDDGVLQADVKIIDCNAFLFFDSNEMLQFIEQDDKAVVLNTATYFGYYARSFLDNFKNNEDLDVKNLEKLSRVVAAKALFAMVFNSWMIPYEVMKDKSKKSFSLKELVSPFSSMFYEFDPATLDDANTDFDTVLAQKLSFTHYQEIMQLYKQVAEGTADLYQLTQLMLDSRFATEEDNTASENILEFTSRPIQQYNTNPSSRAS